MTSTLDSFCVSAIENVVSTLSDDSRSTGAVMELCRQLQLGLAAEGFALAGDVTMNTAALAHKGSSNLTCNWPVCDPTRNAVIVVNLEVFAMDVAGWAVRINASALKELDTLAPTLLCQIVLQSETKRLFSDDSTPLDSRGSLEFQYNSQKQVIARTPDVDTAGLARNFAALLSRELSA